jgi:hypothetical protein
MIIESLLINMEESENPQWNTKRNRVMKTTNEKAPNGPNNPNTKKKKPLWNLVIIDKDGNGEI